MSSLWAFLGYYHHLAMAIMMMMAIMMIAITVHVMIGMRDAVETEFQEYAIPFSPTSLKDFCLNISHYMHPATNYDAGMPEVPFSCGRRIRTTGST